MYTIFGSTGFIGSEILKYLKIKKKKVFAVPRNKTKFNKNLGYVIYCVGSDDWEKKPKKGYYSNFDHFKSVILNNNFKKMIFLSSSRVYVNSKNNTHEDANLHINPSKKNDYYNILKIASEGLINNLQKNVIIIRLSNVLGFNHKSPLLLPNIIKNSIKKKKIEIRINVNSTKDYIHIEDVIDLIMKILKKNNFKIYNVASGNNLKIGKIVKKIKNRTKCKVILKNQKYKILEPKININRIKKEFKFQSKLKIEKDLDNLINKFRATI